MSQEPHDNHPIAGKYYIYHDYGPLGSAARACRISVGGHFDSAEEAIAAWNTRALEAALSASPAAQTGDWVLVPREPTPTMLNAAVDVDSFKLGDISPLGFRISPQMLFEQCYRAMLAAAPSAPQPTEPVAWTDEAELQALVDHGHGLMSVKHEAFPIPLYASPVPQQRDEVIEAPSERALYSAFMEGRESTHGTDRHYGERAWENSRTRRALSPERKGKSNG